MPGTERRKEQRFALVVPAIVTLNGGGRARILRLRTRDLSSAGAFLSDGTDFHEGTAVEIDLLLTVQGLLKIINADLGARIRVRGHIIRACRDGFAVQFSKGFRFQPVAGQANGWQVT